MASMREAIKCSLLQHKTTRRSGTLRRKQKVVYGEPCWVVLCVHSQRIPCLEWYHTQEVIKDHKPFKVIDLLFATYVNKVVEDPRSFVIGLSEEEPIELISLQPATCVEWVQATTETLRRLHILSGPSNIYEAGTSSSVLLENGEDLNKSMETSTAILNENDKLSCIRQSSPVVQFTGSCNNHRPLSLRPPLPQRSHAAPFTNTVKQMGCTSEENIGLSGLSPTEDILLTPQQDSPLYDTPRNELRFDLSSCQTTRRASGSQGDSPRASGHSSPRHFNTVYDTLSPGESSSNVSSSPMQTTMSTNSLCSSLSSELRLSSIVPVQDLFDYDAPRNGYHYPVKYVSLNLSVLVEHILFVGVIGRIWVAGWSDAHDKQLAPVLSLGDELIEIEGRPVEDISQIPQCFYNTSTPGTPIALTFRPIPLGVTVSLVKPISKSKSIGIVLHKKKNRIAEVVADSSSARRGVPTTLPSATHAHHASSAVITDVSGRRLNPFAKNEQFFAKLMEVRDGCEFNITLHPHDFVKLLKQQILLTKHYKVFLAL